MSEEKYLKNNFRENLSAHFRRLVDKSELSHGYIFYGPHGSGRSFFARCLASYLEDNLWYPVENLSDFYSLNPASDSIGIDEVRSLKQALYQTPLRAKKRVAVIHQAERLTNEAQNALLKVAEETPLSGLLILTLRDLDSLEDTLRSRFQPIYFSPVSDSQIGSWLKSEHEILEDSVPELIGRSFGLPGRALKIWQDESYEAGLKLAAKYVSAAPGEIRAILNEVLLPEDFSLKNYLDDLITLYSEKLRKNRQKISPADILSWHKILELRHSAEYLNLSPRIQLNSLKTFLN